MKCYDFSVSSGTASSTVEVCWCTESLVLEMQLSRQDGVAEGCLLSDWGKDGGG